jgi:GxxExxY protein
MTENEISKIIIGKAIEVHKSLGPGLLESAYQECLFYELTSMSLKVEKEKPMPTSIKILNWIMGIELTYWLRIKL